jgi:predicted RNase H-like HicB family nuclease
MKGREVERRQIMNASEILKKPYARLVQPDGEGAFTAEIVEFPGCVADGKTAAEALANVEELAVDWIDAVLEQGQDIPEPMDAANFSGKLVLRMPKGLHKRATLAANREGVSLNQFIVTCLAEAVGERAKPAFGVVQTPTTLTMRNVGFVMGETAVNPSCTYVATNPGGRGERL